MELSIIDGTMLGLRCRIESLPQPDGHCYDLGIISCSTEQSVRILLTESWMPQRKRSFLQAKAIMHVVITRLPNGYDTRLEERSGNGLSGGQKQLLAFARTVVSMPKILMWMEATFQY